MRGRKPSLTVISAIAALLIPLLGAGTTSAGTVPVLAGPWSIGQEGYGHVRPVTVFNGGDPTGLVRRIEWLAWGGPRAVGVGSGFYVAPNQVTAEGQRAAVVIVLFQLGRCHGRIAYNAIDWYAPEYGEHFNAHRYINACTGSYHE